MAKAKTKAKAKTAKGTPQRVDASRKGLTSGNRLLLLLAAMAMVPFSLPTIMVLFCTMLPTLVAGVGERGSNRYAWLCVGGLNFAGVAPWLFDLWFGHHTLDYAIDLLTNITMMVVAYGASALGWALYLATPPAVMAVTGLTSQRHAVRLAAMQRRLIEEWGESVAAAQRREGA